MATGSMLLTHNSVANKASVDAREGRSRTPPQSGTHRAIADKFLGLVVASPKADRAGLCPAVRRTVSLRAG